MYVNIYKTGVQHNLNLEILECVCVCVCVRVRVRVCMRACIHACMVVCGHVWVYKIISKTVCFQLHIMYILQC